MKTVPNTHGQTQNRKIIIRAANTSWRVDSELNTANIFIPISDMAAPHLVSPKWRAARFRLGEHANPAKRDPRGSPFQMPARLADGLGLESDLGHGYPRPFAPSPEGKSEEFWVPRVGLQEGGPT